VPQGNLLRDFSPLTWLHAARVLFAKSTLRRKTLPVKLDLTAFKSPDFQYDLASIAAVVERLKKVPLREEGMKWIIHWNGELCVQFYGERFVDYNYDEFVKKVDISRVGDCFRDVLGIETHVLRRDAQGRPTLQIERIAALAQPTYSAFLGKDELDVYKLEFQEYGKDEVRNWMRTVCSPNATTVADDSYMAFSRTPEGKTKIEFAALQQFALPRIMVMLRLSNWRWYREWLTRGAYRAFWRTTTDNILRRYAGEEDVFVGRPSRRAIAAGQ
jgi:hypothetical protein